MTFDLPFAHEDELAAKVRAAIGVGDWDPVSAITPQFDRDDGQEPWYIPETLADFDGLCSAPEEVLRTMCMMPWNNTADPDDAEETARLGGQLWLFPWQWYDHIPDGYEVVTVCGQRERFEHGRTDDDRRFGCLAFGFVRNAETP